MKQISRIGEHASRGRGAKGLGGINFVGMMESRDREVSSLKARVEKLESSRWAAIAARWWKRLVSLF